MKIAPIIGLMRLILLCLASMFLLLENSFGQWTEPVLLPPPINVNPPGSYYYSSISADGQILCMTIYPGAYGDDDIYISERIGDSAWTVPINAGPNVNNVQRNLSPSITNDRQRLYYVSWVGAYHIFVSYRTGPNWDDWSPGVPLPAEINRGWDFTAMITGDDSTLLFTSTGQPGPFNGIAAVYTSRLQPDDTWTEPTLFVSHIYGPGNDVFHPCLTDSGNTLLYDQWRCPFPCRLEVYYTARNDTGFGEIVPCDSTINNGALWNSSPSAPWDGSFLIFARVDTSDGGSVAAKLFSAPRVMTSSPRQPFLPLPRQRSILVFPNPGDNQSQFRITIPRMILGSPIFVYNVMGQLVLHLETYPYATQQILPLQRGNYATGVLPAGRYFVTATSPHGQAVGMFTICR